MMIVKSSAITRAPKTTILGFLLLLNSFSYENIRSSLGDIFPSAAMHMSTDDTCEIIRAHPSTRQNCLPRDLMNPSVKHFRQHPLPPFHTLRHNERFKVKARGIVFLKSRKFGQHYRVEPG